MMARGSGARRRARKATYEAGISPVKPSALLGFLFPPRLSVSSSFSWESVPGIGPFSALLLSSRKSREVRLPRLGESVPFIPRLSDMLMERIRPPLRTQHTGSARSRVTTRSSTKQHQAAPSSTQQHQATLPTKTFTPHPTPMGTTGRPTFWARGNCARPCKEHAATSTHARRAYRQKTMDSAEWQAQGSLRFSAHFSPARMPSES